MKTTESRFVRLGYEGGLATIEVINSKTLNIIGSEAMSELTAAFTTIGQDSDVRVVVLRGAGDKAFIGGADINEMVALDQATGEVFIRRLAGLCEAIRECPVPVIARLAGWCLGGGRRSRSAAICGSPNPEPNSECRRWPSESHR